MEEESYPYMATKPQLLSPSCLPPGARGSRERHQAGPEDEPCKTQPWVDLGGRDATWVCTHTGRGKHPLAPLSKGPAVSSPGRWWYPHTGVQDTPHSGI